MKALDLVLRHVAAFNSRDLDGVVATFAAEASFTTGASRIEGVAALRAFFADAFDGDVHLVLDLRRTVEEGDAVACEFVERISLPHQAEQRVALAGFYTTRDGLLQRVKVYREGSADL